jgi:hypothetical protein
MSACRSLRECHPDLIADVVCVLTIHNLIVAQLGLKVFTSLLEVESMPFEFAHLFNLLLGHGLQVALGGLAHLAIVE